MRVMIDRIYRSYCDNYKVADVEDVCFAALRDVKTGHSFHGWSSEEFIVPLDTNWYTEACLRTGTEYPLLHQGLSVTCGELIHEKYPDVPHNNWMKDHRFGGIDRKDMIKNAVTKVLSVYKETKEGI